MMSRGTFSQTLKNNVGTFAFVISSALIGNFAVRLKNLIVIDISKNIAHIDQQEICCLA